MKRLYGKRALALIAIPLVLALLGVALFRSAPFASASAAPTVTVTGDLAPGNTVMMAGENWPADDTISITYDGTQIATTSAMIHRSIAGQIGSAAFNIAAQIPVNTTSGAHTITATDSLTGATAQAAITVTAEWAQYGFTAANTRYNPYESAINAGNVSNLTLAWTYDSQSVNTAIPASVAQGGVYFDDVGEAHLHAVNASIGQSQWWSYNITQFGQVAVANGVVYVANDTLQAYDAATGALLWQSAYGRYQYTPVLANGLIYVTGHWNGQVNGESVDAYRVSGCGQATCAPVWSYSVFAGANLAPAVANGTVYFATSGGSVIALNAATGAYEWTGNIPTPGGEVMATVADNGYVMFTANVANGYQGTSSGTLNVFNAAGCGQTVCQPLWSVSNPVGWSVSPAVANGVIYVGGRDGALYAFNEAGCGQGSCAPLWQTAPTAQASITTVQAPAVANGVVYFMNWSPGAALAFNAAGCGAATCSPLWSYAFAGTVSSQAPPTIVAGVLYVSDSSGILYAFHLPATASRSGASVSPTSPTNSTTPAATSSPRGAGQPRPAPHHLLWYKDSWPVGPLM